MGVMIRNPMALVLTVFVHRTSLAASKGDWTPGLRLRSARSDERETITVIPDITPWA